MISCCREMGGKRIEALARHANGDANAAKGEGRRTGRKAEVGIARGGVRRGRKAKIKFLFRAKSAPYSAFR